MSSEAATGGRGCDVEPVSVSEATAYGFPNPDAVAGLPESAHAVFRTLEARGDVTIDEGVDATGYGAGTVGRYLRLFEMVGPVEKRPFIQDARVTVFVLDDDVDGDDDA